jgi:hypothetical protein
MAMDLQQRPSQHGYRRHHARYETEPIPNGRVTLVSNSPINGGITIPKEAHLTPFEGCPVYHKLSEKLQSLEAATYLGEEISSMELIDLWYQDTLYSYPLGYPVTPVEIEYIEGSAESPDLPESENSMLKISEFEPSFKASQHGTAPFIVDCILNDFPNGKGASTWSDVCVRSGYSRRAILRALETLGRKDEWVKGGQINQ